VSAVPTAKQSISQQRGYRGTPLLVNRTAGGAAAIGYWETGEAMRASEETVNQARAAVQLSMGGLRIAEVDRLRTGYRGTARATSLRSSAAEHEAGDVAITPQREKVRRTANSELFAEPEPLRGPIPGIPAPPRIPVHWNKAWCCMTRGRAPGDCEVSSRSEVVYSSRIRWPIRSV